MDVSHLLSLMSSTPMPDPPTPSDLLEPFIDLECCWHLSYLGMVLIALALLGDGGGRQATRCFKYSLCMASSLSSSRLTPLMTAPGENIRQLDKGWDDHDCVLVMMQAEHLCHTSSL